jgi:PPP family 3-phenylpropionic acid transporter
MRNLRLLVLAFGMAVGAFYPFIAVMLVDRGFGAIGVGVVGGLGALGFTIAVPIWGHLADVRLGRPRTLIVCGIGAAMVVLLLNLDLPLVAIGVLFVIVWVFQSGFQPLIDAISLNALSDRRDYARLRVLTSAAVAIVSIASGLVYDTTGYGVAYWLYPLLLLGLIWAAWRVPDVGRADLHAMTGRLGARGPAAGVDRGPVAHGGRPLRGRRRRLVRPTWRLGSAGVALRMAPGLTPILFAVLLVQLGMIAGAAFLPLRLLALGGQPSDVALLSGLGAAAEIPTMLASGVIVARLGLRGLFAGSAAVYAACLASYVVLDAPGLIVATRLLTGAAFAGLVVSVVLAISTLLPRDLQATGQALYQTIAFGVASVVANIVGGVVYASAGVAVFALGAVLVAFGAVVGWFALPISTTSPVGVPELALESAEGATISP